MHVLFHTEGFLPVRSDSGMYHRFSKPEDQLQPPQQQSRRMIHMQQSFPPLPKLNPLSPQQQDRSRISQIMLQQPPPEKRPVPPHPLSQPESQPHPQFVAAKSLIRILQRNFIYTLEYVWGSRLVKENQEVIIDAKDSYRSRIPYPHSRLG